MNKSKLPPVSIDNLLAALYALGITPGSGGGGGGGTPMPENSIYINDWQANSTDLAPYLNNVTGEWDIPASTVLVCNTIIQTPNSFIGRTLNFGDNCQVVPPLPALGAESTYGIFCQPTLSIPVVFKDNGFGSLFITCAFLNFSLTPTFDVSNGSVLDIRSYIFAAVVGGTVNRPIMTVDCNILGALSQPIVMGAQNTEVVLNNFDTVTAFLQVSDAINLQTSTGAGSRQVRASNLNLGALSGGRAISIDQDNGDNLIKFSDCVYDLSEPGLPIEAQNDPAFNANPERSVFVTSDIENFAQSRTTGSLAINGNAIASPNPGAGAFVTPSGATSPGANIARWTSPGNWQLQCEQLNTDSYNVICVGNVSSGAGAFFGNNVAIRLVKNLGTDNEIIAQTVVSVDLTNPRGFALQGNAIFETNDTIDIQIANLDSGANLITVEDCELLTFIGNAS